jgi:hypothetical protein
MNTLWVWDLPEDHLFRLIHRCYDSDNNVDEFADLRRPVNWLAVASRLETIEGRAEARDWICSSCFGGRLFLHQLCDFDFRKPRFAGSGVPILAVDGPTGLRVLKLAIDAYPEAARLPDAEGDYALHHICNRTVKLGYKTLWCLEFHPATKEIFEIVLDAYPEAVSKVKGRQRNTSLFSVLDSGHFSDEEGQKARMYIFQCLLELFPCALEIPASDGRYPLHAAIFSKVPNALQTVLRRFPQAAEKISKEGIDGGRTPLLHVLRRTSWAMSVEDSQTLEILIAACPWSVAIQDLNVLRVSQSNVEPAGDALDYLCVIYSKHFHDVSWFSHGEIDSDDEDEDDGMFPVPYRGGYISASAQFLASLEDPDGVDYLRNYLAVQESHSAKRALDIFLTVLRTMYGRSRFLPLHACVQGRLCRPWHLIMMKKLIDESGDEAFKVDRDGNLPLHLFFESCMVERARAIDKGYAMNDDDYLKAVVICFRMILNANPHAAAQMNPDGRFPLHLALETCHRLPFDFIIEPLLDFAPQALFALDPGTCLHPFANAAIGASANLDLSFLLLRRNPSVLTSLGFAV